MKQRKYKMHPEHLGVPENKEVLTNDKDVSKEAKTSSKWLPTVKSGKF